MHAMVLLFRGISLFYFTLVIKLQVIFYNIAAKEIRRPRFARHYIEHALNQILECPKNVYLQ